MRLLVCGSRDWTDEALMDRVLREHVDEIEDTWNDRPVFVQGGARGADLMAKAWAERNGVEVEEFPADWDREPRRAGYIRNREMLESGVDGVIAFSTKRPATPGTRNMCRIAHEAGVSVCFVTPDGRQQWVYP